MTRSRLLFPLALLAGAAGLLSPVLIVGCDAWSSPSTQPIKVPHPSNVMLKMIPPAKEIKIVKARYGAKDSWIDLTDKLNQRIRDNKLVVQAANDLAGDPLFGTPKRLEVEYILDNQPGKASILEGDSLSLPPFVWTRQRLLDFVRECPAQVSLFGRSFTTGAAMEHNGDRPVCLASIVKVFDLLEVMRQVDEGKIRLADTIVIPRKEGDKTCSINEALDLMIGLSDNDATNAIARLVGYDNVNVLPRQLGIGGLSDQVMPKPGLLEKALDQRVAGGPTSQPALLPQHGTMRALVRFFELLHKDELLTPRISQATMKVFQRNPMPYVRLPSGHCQYCRQGRQRGMGPAVQDAVQHGRLGPVHPRRQARDEPGCGGRVVARRYARRPPVRLVPDDLQRCGDGPGARRP